MNNTTPNKKEEKLLQKQKRESYKKIKTIFMWAVPLVLAGGLVVWIVTLPKKPDTEVISKIGIHTHPQLLITIKGENVVPRGGIGLGPIQLGIHTHDPDNVLHIEKNGTVRESDITVGKFFEIWGKDFSNSTILGNVNGPDGTVTMLVNGEENFEFEKYKMQEGDKIQILYE